MDLPSYDWRELVTDDCPFDLAVACRLVKGIQGQQIPGVLDSSGPYCFYELIHLEEPAFRFGLDHGLITATCSPAELAVLKKQFKAAANSWPADAVDLHSIKGLPEETYNVTYKSSSKERGAR